MDGEWDKVTVLRKGRPSSKEAKSATVINQAMARGNVEITKKCMAFARRFVDAAGSNAQNKPELSLTKLEQSEETKVARVGLEVTRAIQAGRQKLGLTQKELSTRINEKQTIVNEYESGKAIPSQIVLGKLERVLGVKLRGSNVGQPL